MSQWDLLGSIQENLMNKLKLPKMKRKLNKKCKHWLLRLPQLDNKSPSQRMLQNIKEWWLGHWNKIWRKNKQKKKKKKMSWWKKQWVIQTLKCNWLHFNLKTIWLYDLRYLSIIYLREKHQNLLVDILIILSFTNIYNNI